MNVANRYSISIRQTVVDSEAYFEASVREFPDIRVYEETSHTAYEAVVQAIATSIELMQELGNPVPRPLEVDAMAEFSGRVTLRVPKSLHRDLNAEAVLEECSLNQHIVQILSRHVGVAAMQTGEQGTWHLQPKITRNREPYLRVVRDAAPSELQWASK